MRITFTLFGVAILGALAPSTPVFAQEAGAPAVMASSVDLLGKYTGAVEAGIGPQSSDSFVLGKYTGLVDQGAFGVGNFTLRGRDPYDSGRRRSWELVGTNLGLTSRSIGAKYGIQGSFGLSLFYNEIPFYQSDTAYSIFGNAGAAALSLPSNVPLNTTPTLGRQLNTYLHPEEFNLDRKIVGGGLNVVGSGGWQFVTNFSRERKTGLKEQSLSVNVRTDPVTFPEPVGYDTSAFDATASLNRRELQLQLGYNFSGFSNDTDAAIIPSPFMGVAGQGVGALSQYALPPGNTAHDINLAAGYNIGQTTRVNVNLGYGLQLQNEPLLPYTRNKAVTAESLPLTSLDGRVRTSLAQFKVTTQPAKRFDLSASYTYDTRRNETPRAEWASIMEPEWDDIVNWNTPFGFTDQNARIDAGYRLPTRTKLSAGYQRQVRDRTYAEVLTNTENTARVRVSQDFKIGNAYVSYLRSSRTGSDYISGAFDFAAGNLPVTTPLLPYPNNRAQANGYLLEPNYIGFRRYFEADRTRGEVKAGTNFDIVEGLSLELSARRTTDDYGSSPYGVQDSKSSSAAADLAYAYTDQLEIHGFYTHEATLNNQMSLGSAGITGNLPIPQWTWTSAYDDVVDTIGFGATFTAGKLKIGPRYERSRGNTDINVVSGRGNGSSAQWMSKPVPTIATTSYGAKLVADYALQDNASVRLVYDYEHLDTLDPFLNTGPLPTAQTLFPTAGAVTNGWLFGGDASGTYRIHVFAASIVWKF